MDTHGRTSHPLSHTGAFSLIELAVVITIIGVLVGGVLTGQTLIRQSQIMQTVTDLNKLSTAYDSFGDIYQSVPGDMQHATDIWGADSTGTCPDGARLVKKETCNGNGDGLISTTDSAAATEPFRAFQHLANQGLIIGSYSGVPGATGSDDATPGLNVLEGPQKTGYILWSYPAFTNNSTWFDMPAATYVLTGKRATSGALNAASFTTKEAYNLDKKIDDGNPASGRLVTYKNALTPDCTTDNTSASNYKLTTKGLACAFAYQLKTHYSL